MMFTLDKHRLMTTKKAEETWPAFRQLLKRKRSFCDIEKWVLCTKATTTTFIILRIAGQVLDLNALSTMAMVPLSTDQSILVRGCSRKKKSINDDIDIETNRLSSTTLHLSKMTLFVYLLKDKLNLENWNVWIDHQIVTMVVFLFFC